MYYSAFSIYFLRASLITSLTDIPLCMAILFTFCFNIHWIYFISIRNFCLRFCRNLWNIFISCCFIRFLYFFYRFLTYKLHNRIITFKTFLHYLMFTSGKLYSHLTDINNLSYKRRCD